MVTKCPYCGGSIAINNDGLYVCRDCATVLGPPLVSPHRRLAKKAAVLAILYRYA